VLVKFTNEENNITACCDDIANMIRLNLMKDD